MMNTAVLVWLVLGAASPAAPNGACVQTLPSAVHGITMVHMDDAGDGDPLNDGARGYGTPPARDMTTRLRAAGLNLVALTTVVRVANAASTTLRSDLDAPGRATATVLLEQIQDARSKGLAVLVVPHLQLDDLAWRGTIQHPVDSAQAAAFFAALTRETLRVARVAQAGCASAMSVGLELKGLSQQPGHRVRFEALVTAVRAVFHGVITYSANWDEAQGVTFWQSVDVIGVNAFYPLQTRRGATAADLEAGALAVSRQLAALHARTRKKILMTEVGYKAIKDSALRPWEWPAEVNLETLPADEAFQAHAYRALACGVTTQPWSLGMVAWFAPSDPNDQTHPNRWEGPNGFNPLNKAAQAVLTGGCQR